MQDKDVAIFNLGKALVREMEGEGSTDTIGRWMAHHLAELIEAAKVEVGSGKTDQTDKCRDAIINIWKYRSGQLRRRANFGRSASLASVLRTDPWARSDVQDPQAVEPKDTENWILMTRQVSNSCDDLKRVLLALAARSVPETEKSALQDATDADLLDDEANSIANLIKWSNAEDRRGTNWTETVEKARSQLDDAIQKILDRLMEEGST
jgi:hypothetical protein